MEVVYWKHILLYSIHGLHYLWVSATFADLLALLASLRIPWYRFFLPFFPDTDLDMLRFFVIDSDLMMAVDAVLHF